MATSVKILPIRGVPAVKQGDPLPRLIYSAIEVARLGLEDGDILVVCQKVVSKAEGRVIPLGDISPSPFARQMAAMSRKDPRLVEVILRQSTRLIKTAHGHLICETGPGWVCANAGVDESNSPAPETVVLLPQDPDTSARTIRQSLSELSGKTVSVVISDTFGRPWREGLVDVALGCAGIGSLLDYKGRKDLAGRDLTHTIVAVADHLAAAAGLVMEKDSGVAAALVRGYKVKGTTGSGRSLIRPPESDLFR